MKEERFGTHPEKGDVSKITISAHGLTLSAITLGASVQDLRLEGVAHPLVLGYAELSPYLTVGRHFGAIAGRYANRIGHAQASIDGKLHHFDKNYLGRHLLHGGSDGTSHRNWQIADLTDSLVTFSDYLPDGNMGFPGNMLLRVTYEILPGPELSISVLATSDQATLCNFAQHSYFNLDGQPTIAAHRLTVPAETWLPVDEDLIPEGPPASVAGTHLDFRQPTLLGSRLDGPLIDHNLCLRPERVNLPQLAAELEAGGLRMQILTTEPGLQVYAGSGIKTGPVGIGGRPYQPFAGIALEPQIWPDAPNRPDFPVALLEPGQIYRQTTQLRFARTEAE